MSLGAPGANYRQQRYLKKGSGLNSPLLLMLKGVFLDEIRANWLAQPMV